MTDVDRVLEQVESCRDEMVNFAAQLVRIPSVNPPGNAYRECAEALGRRLTACRFDVEYSEATHRPEHTHSYPRVNVVGLRQGKRPTPLVHLNGHFDVVPEGDGWTLDPFGGVVRDGRLYGRGSADMKAGLAAALYAAEAIRRADVELAGSIEVSGTCDEESGGYGGMGHLTGSGRLSSARTDYVIIPEPFAVDRICVGHRGAYWFKVTALGRVAHGSMPHQGVNAIEQMGVLLERIHTHLAPALAERRTVMPIVPVESRTGTINTNAITGGQAEEVSQTPCVPDRCEAIFDRRFLLEEGFDRVRGEIVELIDQLADEDPSRSYELTDLMVFHPTLTPSGSPLIAALETAIRSVAGREPQRVASPGTYDHKHLAAVGVDHCVAYGPGTLEQAHQPDEWCGVEDMVTAAKVMAVAIMKLVGGR